MRTHKLAFCAAMLIAPIGCQSVDPTAQLDAVRTLDSTRSSREIIWEQDEQGAALIRNRVDHLLKDGLSRDDAASIAVLNNRALQAAYEGLGLAAAEIVQASLPSNPTLDGVIALPLSPGNSALTLSAWLSDLWMIPVRKRLAEFEAQAAQFDVAAHVLETAHDAILAWDAVVAARALLDIENDLLGVRRQELQRTEILYKHGLKDTAEREQARAAHVDQQMMVSTAQQQLTEAQTRLDTALSLQDAAEHVPEDAALAIPVSDEHADLAAMLETAMAHRLDLKASRVAIDHASEQLDLQRWMIWRSVSIGIGYEGDFSGGIGEGDNTLGPTFTVEIPIFDQNQAGIASGSYRLRRAIKRHAALQARVRQEVIDRFTRHQTAREELAALKGALTEAVDRELDYAERWNRRMQVTYLEVLATRAGRLELQRRIVDARQQLGRDQLMHEMAVLGR